MIVLTLPNLMFSAIRGPVDVLVLSDVCDNSGDLCHVPGVRYE